MDISSLLRDNIKKLKPYSSARDEFKGEAEVYLDANENPYDLPFSRYPDPLQWKVKDKISKWKGVKPEEIFLGNGSDEVIDLLIRAFCNPKVDNILTMDPSYGMYTVSANINDVEIKKVGLDENFQLNFKAFLAAANQNTKIAFLCSPNNPSGNVLPIEEMVAFVSNFPGIVVVDEAYIDFAEQASLVSSINKYENLLVMQTFSKAMGGASLRLGMGFANATLIAILNKIKPPYNISQPTQNEALLLLDELEEMQEMTNSIIAERRRMALELTRYKEIQEIYPSDANFILVKVDDADKLYHFLTTQGIIVRNRNGQYQCDNCLRITVGTATENEILYHKLNEYYNAKDLVFG